ncbi:DEAD/DEAH box helicase [Nafulsella turpanensis]|uniref:DEAD/DEAH box helicase n=1 Tax=Nafulsella turpanensis TaxID=1265690 RepID=UPI00034B746F|nr:DEAD/DEAH box helicase [Nafulsella turpanensis]
MSETTTTFSDFQLDPAILEGLDAMGFSEPTPVQIQAIPTILANKDLIASAQTGTGKTAAYVLPILHKISQQSKHGGLNTIIIAPTRELAKQIDQQIIGFGYFTGVSSIPVYGGGSGAEFEAEKKAFKTGADIIVCTPGKLIQHLNMGYVKTEQLQHLILDEADRMLDMGFYEDIMKIISHLPRERQTLMFSATMPPKIRQMAKKVLIDPEEINIAISKTAEGVRQRAFLLNENQKEPLLEHILLQEKPESVIVFSSRKTSVRLVEKGLRSRGIKARGISSDLEQKEREEVLRQFKSGIFSVLVATDIMSRGIDISDLAMVINYDVPHDGEDYVHRVGRTARAKATGEAITFVTPREQSNFYGIEKLTGLEIDKPGLPDEIGQGPEWRPAGERSPGGSSNGRRSSGGNRRNNSNRRRNSSPRATGGKENAKQNSGGSEGGKPGNRNSRPKKFYKPRGGEKSAGGEA